MQKTSRPDGRSSAARPIRTKAFPLAVKATGDAGQITAYASTFGNVDLDGDVIEPGAFARTIEHTSGVVPMLWQHDVWEPIGLTTSLEEDQKGLLIEAQLNLDTQRGREAFSLLKQGAMRGLSIGYRTIRDEWQGVVRRLQEVALVEISAVTFPANPEARLVDAKAAAEAIADAAAEIKAGRTLSASNRALLDAALEALQALHAAATPPDEGTSSDGDGPADEDAAKAASDPAGPGIEPTRAADIVRDTLKGFALHLDSRKA